MGPRSGVPHLHGSGWGVSGVSGVSGFGGRVRVWGVRLFVCGGGGFGLFLARPGLFPVPLGLLEGGEEEGAGHLVEGCAARVFHPNGTVLLPVDTTDSAHLYPGGVGDVGDRPDDGIAGTVVRLGGVGLGRGGRGGGRWRSWGGWRVSGAGAAFIGRAGGGGGVRGLGFLPQGIALLSLSSDDSKENFRLAGGWGGWVAAWLGVGFGAVVVDAPPLPPLLPVAHPTSCIRAHSPGRKWRDVTQTPLTTGAVSQSWRPCKRARPKGGSRATMRCRAGPQGYFLGALSVSPDHPDGPGMRRVHHDVNHLQK